jgi:hypothetical protein
MKESLINPTLEPSLPTVASLSSGATAAPSDASGGAAPYSAYQSGVPSTVFQPGPVMAVAGQVASVTTVTTMQTVGQPLLSGDRVSKQNGVTALKQPGAIAVTSWEIKPPKMCAKLQMACRCNRIDISRSYIYVRDNHSLEINDAMDIRHCCTCCCSSCASDHVAVYYADRAPFARECIVAPFPWCCLCAKVRHRCRVFCSTFQLFSHGDTHLHS